MLGEGPSDDINGSFSTAKKKDVINFSKNKDKFLLSLYNKSDSSYLSVNGKFI